MKRLLLLAAAAAALLPASAARAAQQHTVDTETGSGIEIFVSQVFENTPPGGVVPVRIHVSNKTRQAATWNFIATHYQDGDNLISRTDVSAGAGEARTVPFLIFLGPPQRGSSVNITTAGPGVLRMGNVYLNYQHNGSNSDSTPFLAMSRELSAHSWEPLKKQIENAKWSFSATQFDPSDLMDDWRAYAGIQYCALSDTEWAALTPGIRAALRQWVGQGGKLFIATTAPSSVNWGGLRAASAEADEVPYGLGSLGCLLWDGKEMKPDALKTVLMKKRAVLDRSKDEGASWPMLRSLGTLKPNTPLILSFVIVFAALVGPINLFFFAPPARRHRMFWTTPLIAIGGSLILMAVITFQEGVGGFGKRFTLLTLLPGAHEAAVIQDQTARTGLLFGGAFAVKEPTVPSPLRLNLGKRSDQRGTYFIAGGDFSGDWFRSRSLQAQRFTAIRPTRAEIAVVGRDSATGAPVIVSSIESPLETLLFTDSGNKLWRADNIRTGEKTTLRPAHWNDRDNTLRQMLEPAREQVRDTLLALKAPHFTALVTHPKGEILPTLSSIRWWDDRVVYTGPVTDRTHVSAAAPATSPSL